MVFWEDDDNYKLMYDYINSNLEKRYVILDWDKWFREVWWNRWVLS